MRLRRLKGRQPVVSLNVAAGAASGTAGGAAIAGPTISAPAGNSGPVGWSLSATPSGLTATPSSGTLAPGANVTPTLSALVAAIYAVNVANTSGGSVTGSAGNVQFYSPTPPPPSPPPPAPAAAGTGGEAAFSVSSGAGVTNEALCLGMGLAEGQFPNSSGITVSGVTSPQVDIRSTWPDGSARHVIVSGRITVAAASSTRCVLLQGTPSTGAVLTEANLLASGVDATLQFAGGPTMTLSSLIGVAAVSDATGLVTAGRVRQLAAGHQMSSWLYAARLSSSNAHVLGWMEVRFFGSGRVHILPWVENGFTRIASCAGQAGTLTFTMGGTTRFTQADMHLANHCRAVAQSGGLGHWSGTEPDLYAVEDPVYLQATNLVPAYFPDTTGATAQLNALESAYSPALFGQLTTSPRDSDGNGTANGGFDAGMAAGGFHQGIGLLPAWDAWWLTSGDQRAWRAVIANAMGYGRYGVHWRDELTLAPVNPTDVPNKTLSQTSLPLFGATGNRNVYGISDVGNNQFGGAETLPAAAGYVMGDGRNLLPEAWAQTHHPSGGFLAYLLTGHEFFLELSQFVAATCFLRQNNIYREYGLGLQKTNHETVRGQAWGLRSIFQAAAISRDGSALKTGLSTIVANNVTFYNTEYINGPLGLSGAFGTPRQQANFRNDTADYRVNAFEHDFSVGAWGYGCHLKPVSGASLTSMRAYFAWHGQWPVVRLGALGDANTFGYNCAARDRFIAVAPGKSGAQWNTNTGWYANPGEMFKDTPGGRTGIDSSTVGAVSLSVPVTGVGAARDVLIDVAGIVGAATVRVQISTDNAAWSPTGTTLTANTPSFTFNDGLTGQSYVRLALEANAGGGTVFARCSRPSSSNATNTVNTIGGYAGDDPVTGYFPDATSYWGNLQVALLYAVELGVPGAEEAYNRLVGASNWGSFESSAATAPGYAHRPRNVFQWGVGSATGSVAADVWTPGKDAQGRINKASWATVPTGRWIEVAGTRIDTQLTAAILAISAGWDSAKLWGTTPFNSLFQSWSGFTLDDKRGRFWSFNGGHSDGYNNGLYRFDCHRMQWAIECAPSAYADFSVAYRTNGNASYHPDANATAIANFNANNAPGTTTGVLSPVVNGPMYDEIPLDGKPSARHTYQGLAWAQEIGAAGSVMMHMRRLWRYDIASGRWVFKRLFNDQIRGNPAAPSATSVLEAHSAEQAMGIWDAATQRMLCSASGSTGSGSAAYRWDTQAWQAWGGTYGLNFGHAAISVRGRQVVSFNCPNSRASAIDLGRYWLHDLDTSATTFSDVQLGGGLTYANFVDAGAFYDAYGMVYVPPLNRYWIWTRNNSGGMFAVQLDPTTTPWTLSPLTFSNTSPVQERLIQGRTLWISALNAVLVWDHCFVGAKLYKF